MLKRLLSRQRLVFGAQILAGVIAASLSFDFAYAQSPATMGVYNRASSANFGMQNQSAQGINAFGSGAGNMSMGAGPMPMGASMGGMGTLDSAWGAQGMALLTSDEWQSIEVDSPEYVYRGHVEKEPITSLNFYTFPDGTDGYAVLSASADKTAKLWMFEGKFDQETTEWFVTNARMYKTYKDVHKQGLTSAVFSPDFRFVLTSSYDGNGRLWNIGNQENIRAYLGSKDRLWKIAVASSGQLVAGACNDGRIYFWESMTVKRLGSLPNREDASKLGEGFEDVGHEGPVFDVAFSPDSGFVATAGADGTVRIWNLALQRQVGVIKASKDKVYSVKFSPDGSLLVTASRDKTARVFNATTREEICRFVGHTGAVREAVFAGSYVCTCSDDGTARLWSMISETSDATADRGMGGIGGMGSMGSMTSGSMGSMTPPGTGVSMGPTMGSGYPAGPEGQNEAQKVVGKPVRKPGKPKGTELACFNVNSPVFSVAVSEDLVYLVTGSADGAASIWRVPGNARYYGDSGSRTGAGYGTSGYGSDPGFGSGFGTDPMANPDQTLQMGGISGGR